MDTSPATKKDGESESLSDQMANQGECALVGTGAALLETLREKNGIVCEKDSRTRVEEVTWSRRDVQKIRNLVYQLLDLVERE